jgi:hypothetical protein
VRPLALFGFAAAVVALAGPVAAAPVPKHLKAEQEKGDRAKLQGKWKVEAVRGPGIGRGGPNLLAELEMVFEFRDDALTATVTGRGLNLVVISTLKFDPGGARRVRAVDAVQTGPGAPMKMPDEAFGFAFDGDKLLLATRAGGTGKEAGDPLKPGPADAVFVLVRVK